MKKILILISLVCLICSCEKKQHILVGKKAFDFELSNLQNNSTKLSDFSKQKIMLHFWADWCASCREEFYTLQNVFETIKYKNATIIGVNVGQSKEHIIELISEYDVTFTMLSDSNETVSKKYAVHSLPMNIFINRKGNIDHVISGWLQKEKILQLISNMN